jgi:hypothetical protein
VAIARVDLHQARHADQALVTLQGQPERDLVRALAHGLDEVEFVLQRTGRTTVMLRMTSTLFTGRASGAFRKAAQVDAISTRGMLGGLPRGASGAGVNAGCVPSTLRSAPVQHHRQRSVGVIRGVVAMAVTTSAGQMVPQSCLPFNVVSERRMKNVAVCVRPELAIAARPGWSNVSSDRTVGEGCPQRLATNTGAQRIAPDHEVGDDGGRSPS